MMKNNQIQFNPEKTEVCLTPPPVLSGGTIAAIPSKSHAHRLLIAASLSAEPVRLICPVTSRDIDATADCLTAMGAAILGTEDGFMVRPRKNAPASAGDTADPIRINVGESGSTLRFLLPVLGALGISALVEMEGRLPERPLSPLDEVLRGHGITLSSQSTNPLEISGRLTPGEYTISGGISSQYITGLLFALPLLTADSILNVTGKLESRPYVDITLQVLREFGIRIEEHTSDASSPQDISTVFRIPGNQCYQPVTEVQRVEADWSNAAFFLAAGALLTKPVTVTGCNMKSPQGDKRIVELLRQFGASIEIQNDPSDSGNVLSAVSVTGDHLRGIIIDAADIPDLVPILAVTGAFAEGCTVIRNIERLRIKESDRVATVMETLQRLGARIEELPETDVPEITAGTEKPCLRIQGTDTLPGGSVSSHNDHRIAMAAAIASLRCSGPVTITDPMAVKKSYPGFYEDLGRIE